MKHKQTLPVLPVKNTLLYPGIELAFTVARMQSVGAVEEALRTDHQIVVITQKDPKVDVPNQEDLYVYGCKGMVKQSVAKNGSVEVSIFGQERVRLVQIEQTEPFMSGTFETVPLPRDTSPQFEALHRTVLAQASEIHAMVAPSAVASFLQVLYQADEPLIQIFLLASMFGLDMEREQKMYACRSGLEAAQILYDYFLHEKQVLEVQKNISQKIQSKLNKQQRDHLLREQLEQIQRELGESEPGEGELKALKEKVDQEDLPENVRKELRRELERVGRLPQATSEYQIARTYAEFLGELPWTTVTPDNLDLLHARRILDEDHYNLEEIKDRIVEQLVVLKLNPSSKAPILCFVGPPGVGKTSLGESIARALGRKFERISLGGLHDEAELRGHRRTYIGAMPGRIIKAIHRAEAKNPVLMLDEIDKLGRDFRGDPAAALMEVLDPAQNVNFRDNYLDLPFDLSKVFFITTANTLDTIPRPLLDRMEVLQLSGYSDQEKLEIARRYLVPEKIKETGLSEEQIHFTEDALLMIIRRYTREAGLRQLGRSLSQLSRKVAVKISNGETHSITVNPETVTDLLGSERFSPDQIRKNLIPGVATGLAWTPTGGDVLFIEAILLPGGKDLKLTGQLGDVMKESAQAAQSYLWSNAEKFGIQKDKFTGSGLHIHIPEGAIPKDGPSAGVTMATALASLYTNKTMRSDTAMTGELTLSGLVLPVGGLKEKALAAHRNRFKRIIIPQGNVKDLRELPEMLRKELEFIPAEILDDVLKEALIRNGPERLEKAA